MSTSTYLVFVAGLASAPLMADSLVYTGAGKVGPWTTEVVITNPSDSPEAVQLADFPEVEEVGCPGVCEYTHVDLPPHSTASFPIQSVFGTLGNVGSGADRLYVLYITPIGESPMPSAKVRVVNTAALSQAVELPPIRAEALALAPPAVLTFPDATRSAASHTNLILAQVGANSLPTTPCAVEISVFDVGGERKGTTEVTLEQARPLFLTDLLVRLGLTEQDGGSVQVIPNNCGSPIWGLTARVDNALGTVVVSQGAVP